MICSKNIGRSFQTVARDAVKQLCMSSNSRDGDARHNQCQSFHLHVMDVVFAYKVTTIVPRRAPKRCFFLVEFDILEKMPTFAVEKRKIR